MWQEKHKRYDRYQQDIVFLLDGVLLGSGLVGGQGIMGVIVAGVVVYLTATGEPGSKPKMPFELSGWAESSMSDVLGLALFLCLVGLFVWRCRKSA